ncbi:uncharacterized protein LOC115452320 [Manduca sexta]|uniref:uncharacterized protein LOC115452320 n=1 Tax=Manduca sexta TaxID=7130 RepID=UPI001183DC6D|nr:uncharacterized protein LOC115452320 [Manduca sexta]
MDFPLLSTPLSLFIFHTFVTMLSTLWHFVIFVNLKAFINALQKSDDYKLSVLEPLLVNCGMLRGVCLKSGACPWERIIPDNAEVCTRRHNNLICCEIARIRMPVDMFVAYE